MKVKNFKQFGEYLIKMRKGFYTANKEAVDELLTLGSELGRAKSPEVKKNVNKTASFLQSVVKQTKNKKEILNIFQTTLENFRELKTTLPMYEFQSSVDKLQNVKSEKDMDKDSLKAMFKEMANSMKNLEAGQADIYKEVITECVTLQDYEVAYKMIESIVTT